MSTHKDKNIYIGVNFSDAWERIVLETNIKYLKDLAKIVGVTQPNISSRKQENLFPYGWAYLVAKEYDLLTEWILTGEGPKRLNDHKTNNKSELTVQILRDFDQWLSELIVGEPYRKDWAEACLKDAFPMFKEWMKRKESPEWKSDSITQEKKIA